MKSGVTKLDGGSGLLQDDAPPVEDGRPLFEKHPVQMWLMRRIFLEKLLAAAQNDPDDEKRARMLTFLALLVTEDRRADVLEQALQAAQRIPDELERTKTMTLLAPQLSKEFQKDTLRSSVLNTLWANRSELLYFLPFILPLFEGLEGPAGLEEIGRAVCDTGRWFP